MCEPYQKRSELLRGGRLARLRRQAIVCCGIALMGVMVGCENAAPPRPATSSPSPATGHPSADVPVDWVIRSAEELDKERRLHDDAQRQADEAQKEARRVAEEVRQLEQVHRDVNRLMDQQQQIEQFNRGFQRDWERLQGQQRSFEFYDPPVPIRF